MTALNLPSIPERIRIIDDKEHIFDVCRSKYVRLTPEEWVRQHFLYFLIEDRRVPRGLISVEEGIRYLKSLRRVDVIVYDRNGKPQILVECKAPSVRISQDTIGQVSVYNQVLGAAYLVVTNGLVHFCCKLDQESGTTTFLQQIPSFEEL